MWKRASWMDFDGLDLAAAAASIATARDFVGRRVNGFVGDEAKRDLMLMVSELATNAVLHADTAFHVSCHVGHRIRIEVSDLSTVMPTIRRASPIGGLGLQIVDQLSCKWGVDRTAGGKVVWLEVPSCGT
jgi:two-component sensor histidine kinase